MDTVLVGFSFIGWLFNMWWLWLLAASVFMFLAFQNQRKKYHLTNTKRVLLLLEIPRENDKKELSAEQMFASLHGILRPKSELIKEGSLQDHISFEFASAGAQIRFYVSVPIHLRNFVEGQIYAQYPTVQIHEAEEDYSYEQTEFKIVHSTDLVLSEDESLPIKTFDLDQIILKMCRLALIFLQYTYSKN